MATVLLAVPAQADAARFCDGHAATVDMGEGEVPTSGADVIRGTGGDDYITVTPGDILCAGNGVDTIRGDATGAVIFGGGGDDDIQVTTTAWAGAVWYEGSVEFQVSTAAWVGAVVYGDAGDDFLKTGNGNDALDGGVGNDVLQGGSGEDVLYGGDGDDSMNGQGGDDIVNGQAGADKMWGWTGSDRILGGNGNDTIDGGDGDDFLYGGPGGDTVTAGAGVDKIYHQTIATMVDPPPDKELNHEMELPAGATGVGLVETLVDGSDSFTGERWVDMIVPEDYWSEEESWAGGRWM